MPLDFVPSSLRLVISPSEIQTLITEGEGKVSKAFQKVLADLRENRSAAEIDRLIRTGKVAELERLLNAAFSYIGNVIVDLTHEAGAATTAGLATASGVKMAYDVTGEMVISEIARRRKQLIADAVQSQIGAYGHIAPQTAGLTGKQRAKAVIEATGLGERDLKWSDSYREALEKGSKAALNREFRDKRFDGSAKKASDKPLTPEKIDKMVEAYKRKMLARRIKERSEAEAIRSYNEGQHLATEQAVRRGDVRPEQMASEWDAIIDEVTRDSHRHLNGQKQPHGRPFQGFYSAIRFPHDPQADSRETRGCRCRLRPVLIMPPKTSG